MKSKIFTLIGICFLFFSCQNELLDLQEDAVISASMTSSLNSGNVECTVIDADRAPFGDRQPAANFWWSLNGGNDYFTTSTYYSSLNGHSLNFEEVDDFTAHITGSTINENGCIVEVDVYLIDKKSWNVWSTTAINGINGQHKKEGTAGNASDSSLMSFYVIDSERSTLTATGNCGGREGTYGLEQRPDPATDNANFGAHIGPGGANYDSNLEAIGLSTWGYMFDLDTKERLWVMDFNFLIECVEIPCYECLGKVTDLTVKYNGAEEAIITVETKKDGVDGTKIVFQETVAPGASFSFVGNDKNGTLGTEIKIYVGDGGYTKIHTSCSKPIGPGLIAGVFEVISGSSLNGGALCPVETPPGGDCGECEGKINELELQYKGAQAATIRVETKKESSDGNKIVFNDIVDPNDPNTNGTFTFYGNDKKWTLGTEITIYINDVENTTIHTSCSKPVGPGLISGAFEVISGSSREGGALCPVVNTPGGDCAECKGGVTSFTFLYTGDSGLMLKVEHKNAVLFNQAVTSGESYTLNGSKDDGKFEENNLIFTLNGSKLSAPGHDTGYIHMSCSKPFYVGLPIGDSIVVTSGTSKDNGPICEDTPPIVPDCQECKGGVTSFTFKYTGDTSATLKVEHKNAVLFDRVITPGESITLYGSKDDGKFEENNLIFILDGIKQSAPGHDAGNIHMSCSKPFYVGLPIGANMVVTAGSSKDNGKICEGTPPNQPNCQECDGKITRLDLQYNGTGSALIEVIQKKDDISVFSQTVQAGGQFTVYGVDDKGTLGTEIIILVNNVEARRIHTSCSVTIGAGSIFGDFTVIGGASRNGGELCPVEPTPASNVCDCDGKIVKMSVVYGGASDVTIKVGADANGNNATTFTNVQNGDTLAASLGNIGNWWYWSVNGNVEASIHTSCSDDILGNIDAHKSTFGNMGTYPDPVEGDGNGTFLVTSHTDDKGNTCSLDLAQ
jgi:hypothetical protein